MFDEDAKLAESIDPAEIGIRKLKEDSRIFIPCVLSAPEEASEVQAEQMIMAGTISAAVRRSALQEHELSIPSINSVVQVSSEAMSLHKDRYAVRRVTGEKAVVLLELERQ